MIAGWLRLVPAALCVVAAGAIYRQTLVGGTSPGWRRHAAASIPAAYTLLLLLLWVLPIQLFLASTLPSGTRHPVVILTLLGLLFGANLPNRCFRPRRRDADGWLYAALGVRRFRNLVTYGDPMVRLMRRVDPQSRARLKGSTIADREAGTRRTERIHWALLLGSIPAAVWAALAREPWFTAYVTIANVPMNVYPILLQRYTRARLARIPQRRYAASTDSTLQPCL